MSCWCQSQQDNSMRKANTMAKKQKEKSWSDIERETRQYVGKILSSAAGKIRDDLTEEAFNSIVYFYTSYSPKYYNRHYYNFMENSFEKYYSNPHNKIYRGGVRLTPKKLDDIYQDSTIEVFDTVYAGLHGPASAITFGYSYISENPHEFSPTPRMTPSPIERILARRDYIVDHIDDYIEFGKAKANKK